MTPAAVIRARREALGWSRYQLAQAAGVPQTNLRRFETGEQARVEWATVERLARALGLSLGDFDQREEEQHVV